MPTSTKVQNYFGLTAQQAENDNARAVIIPAPYETLAKGSKEATKAIFEASQELELFDDELWVEPYKIGIHSQSPLKIETVDNESENPFKELTDAVKSVVEMDRFPVVIGGERSISLGSVNACLDKYSNLSVLMLGGQADLRSEVDGNPYALGTSTYRLHTTLKTPNIVQVGTRNISWEEVAWLEKEQPDINIFWARNQAKWDLNEIVGGLSENVLVSIDMSVLDPSIMPAVHHPEPGGWSWYPLLDLLKLVCVRKNVVAAEVTGLTPIKNLTAPNYLAAHLVYKLIGYRFALDLGVSKKYL